MNLKQLTKGSLKNFLRNISKEEYLMRAPEKKKVVEYIGGDKVVERLNEVFGIMNWCFTISDRIIDIDIGHIAILGRLVVIENGQETVKEQWGSSVIDTYTNGKVVCLGDNIKAATTDALKKVCNTSWHRIVSL